MHAALHAGSERGQTLDDNTAAYRGLGLVARPGVAVGERDLRTTVLGVPLALPVMISPVGVQAVHPEGEVAVARAAASRGVSTALSCFASRSVEDVCAAGAPTLVQLHWIGGRDRLAATLERARAAGAAGVVLTTDWSFSQGRDWGSPAIPERVDLRTALRFGPQCLARPRWLARYARTGAPPTLGTPNLLRADGSEHGFFSAYREWLDTPPPSWEDVAWLREQWGGAFLLKGVVRVDDAHRAVDAGVTAISVSNHGGNNLDGTPAAVRALPAVAEAVGHEVEVLTDGGVRRGSDVVAALALGARAVLLGRAPLWGLAADGQAGVEDVLDVLRRGVDAALLRLGRRSVHELSPADVVVPPGFVRVLGAPRT
ncbi:mycofactocin biosynthesis FMN-dependent deaminase MftD [Rhodococcus aerolatus]